MHPQDTVYLCVFVRIDAKSRKACENPHPVFNKYGVHFFFFSMFEAHQPCNLLIRLTFWQVVSFIFAYNYKASYHHGPSRSCHKPIYGVFQPMRLFELPKPWEAFLCFSATSVSWTRYHPSRPMVSEPRSKVLTTVDI